MLRVLQNNTEQNVVVKKNKKCGAGSDLLYNEQKYNL